MDDGWTTREILAAAFAADDECRRRDAESDRRLAELMRRHDEAQAVKRRDAGDLGLIYKTRTTEPEPVAAPFTPVQQQQTQARQFMTDEEQRPWNAWLQSYVNAAISKFAHEFAGMLGGEVGRWQREERQLVDEKIGAVNADLEILRSVVKGHNATPDRGEPVDLPKFVAKRDGTHG